LIRIMVKAILTKPNFDLNKEFSCDFRVWPNDLDINMHMNNGRYLAIMDLARIDMMAQMGLLFPALRHGWLPILGATQMSFFRPLNPLRKFTIVTKLEYWDERWFVVTQRFVCAEKTVAMGRIRGLFRGKQGNITPQALLGLTGMHAEQRNRPTLSPDLQAWLNSLETMKQLRD
jgi:acyl-CoA thioesterase FadM